MERLTDDQILDELEIQLELKSQKVLTPLKKLITSLKPISEFHYIMLMQIFLKNYVHLD